MFTLHGTDVTGAVVPRRNPNWDHVVRFCAKRVPCEVVMEACGASHHSGRWLQAQGQRVRLLRAQYAKPFVKPCKSDRHDAAAICTTAGQQDTRDMRMTSAERLAAMMAFRVKND